LADVAVLSVRVAAASFDTLVDVSATPYAMTPKYAGVSVLRMLDISACARMSM
jgi:hypothetical protein